MQLDKSTFPSHLLATRRVVLLTGFWKWSYFQKLIGSVLREIKKEPVLKKRKKVSITKSNSLQLDLFLTNRNPKMFFQEFAPTKSVLFLKINNPMTFM